MLALLLAAAVAPAQAPPRDARVAAPVIATIAGIVVSDESPPRPLRRARVTLTGQALDGERAAITGDDGAFTFDGLPPGSYSLSAAKGAYVKMNYGASHPGRGGVPLTIAAGTVARVVLRLPRGAVITGTVVDTEGAPVPGIGVAVLERRSSFGGAQFVSVGAASPITDDRGVYRVYGLPAGDYVVAARPAMRDALRPAARPDRSVALAQVFAPSVVDPSRATRVSVRPGEERGGVDIQLQYLALASLSGAVTAPPGYEPAEIAIAPVRELADPGTAIHGTRANVAGRFWFSSLPAGPYRVVARSTGDGGTLTASTEVTLDGEDLDQLVLSLQPPLSIAGLIVFRGDSRPPTFGTMRNMPTLSAALIDAVGAMPKMDIDGVRFRIDGVLPGPFRIGGDIAGLRTPIGGWWLTSIAANGVELLDASSGVGARVDNAIATFSDRVSQIAGTVIGAGGPAGGATVVAFSTDRGLWFPGSRRIAAVAADSTGRYVIRNLPPGGYGLVAVSNLGDGEWFDPAILERLSQAAITVTVTGADAQTRDLVIRYHSRLQRFQESTRHEEVSGRRRPARGGRGAARAADGHRHPRSRAAAGRGVREVGQGVDR
jgi:uncharacterized protein (DUF2141 family)